jgi:two-component system, probable response regulator PhcQ
VNAPVPNARPEVSPSGIPTILLVDDEPRVTAAIRRLMRHEPWKILEAHSGREALHILAREAVHVLVTDEMMPEMRGSTLISEVRRRYPDTIRIVLSGRADLDAAVKAINDGEVFRFLLKPCSEVDLVLMLRQALRIQALEAENRRLRGTVRDQAEILRDLEVRNPGITRVERGPDGSITV